MLSQQIPTHIKTCWECQRLELLAKRATVELTLLEAAKRLSSEPSEDERLGVLVTEAREQQRGSQRAFWNHAICHSGTEIRLVVN
jgi:hypothetical protein